MVDKKTSTFKYNSASTEVDLDRHFSRSWQLALKPLFGTVYFNALMIFIDKVYSDVLKESIVIDKIDIFEPFKNSNPDDIRVVLIGAAPNIYSPNGLLFGSEIPKAIESSALLKKHETMLCKNLSERHYFDHSLRDWADQGVLMMNLRPILHKSVPSYFADIFDYFILNVLTYLSELNEDLIIAGATVSSHSLMDRVEGDDNLRVKSLGFVSDNPDSVLLYDQINNKLKSIHAEKIDWVSRV